MFQKDDDENRDCQLTRNELFNAGLKAAKIDDKNGTIVNSLFGGKFLLSFVRFRRQSCISN